MNRSMAAAVFSKSTATMVFSMLALVAAPSQAQVDEGFNAQNFRPPIDPYGYITLNGARALPAGHPFFAAYVDYADDPLDLRDIREGQIEHMTFVHAVAAIGLVDIGEKGGLNLGVVVPWAYEMEGFGRDPGTGTGPFVTPPAVDLPDRKFADIRTELKLVLFDRSEPLGVAFRGYGIIPTGEDKYFRSNDERFGAGGGIVLEKEFAEWVRIGAEAGYEWLEGNTEISKNRFTTPSGEQRLLIVDDKFHLRGGIATRLYVKDLWLVVEGNHWTRATHPWDTTRESPAELGLALRFDRRVLAMVGASKGLTNGVGAPDYRLFASLGFRF
jgi:hypothetical protein